MLVEPRKEYLGKMVAGAHNHLNLLFDAHRLRQQNILTNDGGLSRHEHSID